MRIEAAETIVVEIPFKLRGSGVGIMPTAWKSLEFCLVRLTDELGNVGWGEGFGYFTVDATKAIIDRLILPTLVGSTIGDIPRWNLEQQRRIHMFGRYGITVFAISGVDIALWDLAAKRAGVPLQRLLGAGEGARLAIPFYASLVRYADASLATTSCDEVLKAGFRSIKLHEVGLDEIEACRTAVGPSVDLCTDVNCGWSEEFVAENRGRIEGLGLTWLEEPIFPPEDFAALARVRGSGVPIAAGENWCTTRQFSEALRAGAVDIVQPSVTKVGGVSEFLSVLRLSDAAQAAVMPHSPYFGPGLYASLHIAAAHPSVHALEYNFVDPDAWLTDVNGLRDGGTVRVPEAPGLGFEPDPDVIRRYRRA
ncbi:mandelate racemase/muconate lactonizing enzyme family protein [Lichenihabitans sp. Uapishka_5]|uniref:mandelate racemase/muconate lactonizing enzyme family protein n=1 Tax=Lichenihabitans sp. Uapishka_5 TaxID=3037302 RepID=UPI0029E828C6|nr:mandelate racemase/muconate lactonizing enzyme family protein [Lichenihabitans sp. Uapishka_5]MDX7952567.1 mandelate racemase/muconate lactonizing enzyme family protein [Lichenihabitans sp. Uapishka_5]